MWKPCVEGCKEQKGHTQTYVYNTKCLSSFALALKGYDPLDECYEKKKKKGMSRAEGYDLEFTLLVAYAFFAIKFIAKYPSPS
jgi:hypothetical protein